MKTNSRTTILILLCIIVSLLFGYVTYRELKVGDFEDHIGWARNLAANGYVFVPAHSLYEELIVTVRAFLPYNVLAKSSKLLHQIIDIKSYEIAAVVVTILTYLAFAILIYNRLLHEWKKDEKEANPWLAGLITLVAMLVSPIFLFTLPDRIHQKRNKSDMIQMCVRHKNVINLDHFLDTQIPDPGSGVNQDIVIQQHRRGLRPTANTAAASQDPQFQ